MKFSLLFVLVLCALASAQNDGPNTEAIIKIPAGFGSIIKKGLKDLAKDVGKTILSHATDILTNGLRLNPNAQVQSALSNASQEGIFEGTANLLVKRAEELALEFDQEQGPSHEGIASNFGYYHQISAAEEAINFKYNKTLVGSGPSHEGILGNLGGVLIKGLGGLIGGKVGNVISTAGDIVGNLFFALPSAASQEGLILPSQEGILDSAFKVLQKGASKLAEGLVKSAFDSVGGSIGNIFLARGAFKNYNNIQNPASDLLQSAKASLKPHYHPKVQVCIDAAENNFTQLFNEYVKHGEACVNVNHKAARPILYRVADIVLDAINRVEESHRDTQNCFDNAVEDDRVICLDQTVPAQIAAHRKKIQHYAHDLAFYVASFSDINTGFDECLVGHLGFVRREIYHIVRDFHSCVAREEYKNLPQEKESSKA